MEDLARALVRSVIHDRTIPPESRNFGASFVALTPEDPWAQTKISSFIFLVNPQIWDIVIRNLDHMQNRMNNQINNNLFQKTLGSPSITASNFSLHLSSLFTKTFGGKGFAAPRKLRCAKCQVEHHETTCPQCQHDWATGHKCWCYFPTSSSMLDSCEDCYDEGFIGELCIDN